jgi:hypothetical protein
VTDRYADVNTVLYRVLLLNLVVALAKNNEVTKKVA